MNKFIFVLSFILFGISLLIPYVDIGFAMSNAIYPAGGGGAFGSTAVITLVMLLPYTPIILASILMTFSCIFNGVFSNSKRVMMAVLIPLCLVILNVIGTGIASPGAPIFFGLNFFFYLITIGWYMIENYKKHKSSLSYS